MKKIVTIFLLTLSSQLFAQNITLDEVISLRTRSIASVEEFLTAKGWSLIKSKEESESTLGLMDFAYNKSRYDDKAESFITYLYSEVTGTKRISIQINKKEKYSQFLNSLKSKGVTLIKSKIEDGSVKKVYQNKNLTFVVSSNTQEGEFSASTSNTYTVFIITNPDYSINYDE